MGRVKKCRKKRPPPTISLDEHMSSKLNVAEPAGPYDQHSVEDLIKEAQDAFDNSDYRVSYNLLTAALKKEPNNAEALHHLGSALLELNDPVEAKKVIRRSCDIDPQSSHEKWLILAELEEKRDALQCYRFAGSIVEPQLSEPAVASLEESEVKSLKRVLSKIHVCIAELFMSELCDEEEAQEEVSNNVGRALEIDPMNPEALQAKANFNFIIGNDDLAEQIVRESVALWLPDVVRERKGGAVADWKNVPDFNVRIENAKLCLELRLYSLASKILLCLLSEDETNPDVLYLYGLALYLKGRRHYPSAKMSFKYAKQAAADCGWTDEASLEHIDELLEKLKDVNSDGESDGEEEGEGEDDEESDDDEEEDDEEMEDDWMTEDEEDVQE